VGRICEGHDNDQREEEVTENCFIKNLPGAHEYSLANIYLLRYAPNIVCLLHRIT